MTPITLNLDGVEAWSGGEILPPGKHPVRIDSAEEGQSSGGHPQVELTFTAIAGEHAGAGIRDWLVVAPAAMGKVRQFLEAVGFQIPPGDFYLPTGQLVGRRLSVVVREEPNQQGEKRSRVKVYEAAAPPGGQGNGYGQPPAQAPAQPQAQMSAGGFGAPAAAPTRSAVHDDDIPF
jgi:hypothetical protein